MPASNTEGQAKERRSYRMAPCDRCQRDVVLAPRRYTSVMTGSGRGYLHGEWGDLSGYWRNVRYAPRPLDSGDTAVGLFREEGQICRRCPLLVTAGCHNDRAPAYQRVVDGGTVRRNDKRTMLLEGWRWKGR